MPATATETAPEAEADARDDSAWRGLLDRLNRQSVTKHFDAYADVDWDRADWVIDPTDPRWELGSDHPLGRTEWYRNLTPDVRARLALHDIATKMKIGAQFESVLKKGLLDFASTLPNGAPEFRYAYHELIEEAQHSLMFQEFVNRTGFDVPGMPRAIRPVARFIATLGRRFPPAFFVFVLGGEDPIDHVQRKALSADHNHPLLERIMRIHVTEEARHLSFARHYLKREVPRLPARSRFVLSIQAPLTLGVMAALMLQPAPELIAAYGIPRSVLREAYGSDDARQEVRDSLRKVRRLCRELGLVTPLSQPLWRALRIWDYDD